MVRAQSSRRPGGQIRMDRALLAGAFSVVVSILMQVLPLHAAEDDLCGEPKAGPPALYERLAKDSGVREMHRSDTYVGLENGANGTLWTFTLPKHPAHPAAVCRRVMERRGVIDIPTTIVCEGAAPACAELKADFEALNARIIDDLHKQGKGR